jgi:hypothetical protein
MADLATYLLALDRHEEAAEIGKFVSENVPFQGNYNLWSPAAAAIVVGVRALRLLGQSETAERVYQAIRDNPSYVIHRQVEEQMLRDAQNALQNRDRGGRVDRDWKPARRTRWPWIRD